jgi:hypothetical protein
MEGDQNSEGKMARYVSSIKETEMHKALSPVKLKERDLELLGVEWSIILNWISK